MEDYQYIRDTFNTRYPNEYVVGIQRPTELPFEDAQAVKLQTREKTIPNLAIGMLFDVLRLVLKSRVRWIEQRIIPPQNEYYAVMDGEEVIFREVSET